MTDIDLKELRSFVRGRKELHDARVSSDIRLAEWANKISPDLVVSLLDRIDELEAWSKEKSNG